MVNKPSSKKSVEIEFQTNKKSQEKVNKLLTKKENPHKELLE